MWLKSAPLSAQMMMVLVGSIVATATALTTLAYRTMVDDLDRGARGRVRLAAASRSDAVSRVVNGTYLRAERFLASSASICGERRSDGGIAWERGCTRTALQEFRLTEHAHGAALFADDQLIAGAGLALRPSAASVGLAWLSNGADGTRYYSVRADYGNSWLLLEFPVADLSPFFEEELGLGDGEVFLREPSGTFLTPARFSELAAPAGVWTTEAAHPCANGPTEWRDLDYRGVDTFHGLSPINVFAGGACVEAHLGVDSALQPASLLMNVLILRGGVLAGLGVLLALLASSWLAGPVLRLAADAYALEDGDFDRPIRVEGPSEVAELGRSLGTMSRALLELIARERRARREAEDANRAKDEFLAVLSHELRTPLTVTLGWARLLKLGTLTPGRSRDAVEAIERATITQTHLVNDLLDVSRIIAGRLQLEHRLLTLAIPVSAAIDQIREVAARKQVQIDVALADDLQIEGDGVRLQQVVSNLLTNAVKFTPSGGRIDVRLTEQDGQAELQVQDTGVGIAPDMLPFIFDRFRQADNGPTRRYGGLGLGLAIVRHLVTLHGGSVQALSRGGGTGATFVVQLPLATVATSADMPLEVPPTLVRLSGVHLLLVDDDDDTRQMVQALLEENGAVVTTAGSATEARRVLARTKPDVIVSDVAMPSEDGYTFVRTIRELGIQIPAIALTAFARSEDVVEAESAGFQRHLPKPVDGVALVAAVGALTTGQPELNARTA